MELPETFVKGFHDEQQVRKMQYNILGRTGLRISRLGFGGAALAHFYEDYQEEAGIQVLQEAIKRGINYVDTAAFYGNDDRKSEKVIGKALKDVPREAYYIATKVGRYTASGFDFSYDATIRSVDTSLQLLGLSYIDVIQAHDIEFAPNLDIIINETLPALADVVKAGKARYIGVTGYPISVLKEAIERSNIQVDCVLCYARSTLIDMTLLDYLPFFQSRNMGIISAAGVAMGLLSNRGPFSFHPGSEELKQTCAAAAQLCKERGVELGKLAAYHSMSVDGPATNLLGINSFQVLELNLDVCLNGLTNEEQQILDEVKTKIFSKLQGNQHWEGVELAKYREKQKKMKENSEKHSVE